MADILTPALGESVTEATIAKWTKKVGDAVKKDELLVELETDKVSLEVVSPADGVLADIKAAEGDTVVPGTVLGVVSEGADAAYALVRNELKRNPTLLGLDKLIEARVLTAATEMRADLDLAKGIIQGYTRRLARYRCDSCGFKARQFYWRCPACGGWETYSPKRSEEFELIP